MATLKDVARLANVNPSTVSRVLHGGNARVSESTRTRIILAADELHYKVNTAARSLRTRMSAALALLIPDVQNPTYAQIIEGADKVAQEKGYEIFLLNAKSRGDRRTYMPMLQEGRVDGLIVSDALLEDEFINQLERQNLPFILVNRRTAGNAPYVVADDAEAARIAIDYLMRLGHRKIGYLAGPLHYDTAVTRLKGARQAFRENGLDFRDLPVEECAFSGHHVEDAVRSLLEKHPDLTALAGANFLITLAAAKALHKMGKRIPEEISLIGHDDTLMAELAVPGITCVKTPLSVLGGRAVELLIGRLNGKAIVSEVVRSPAIELIIRESTAAPR